MQADADGADLSKNLYVIVFAYLAAFLPWTILTTKDFIGTKWKTVRETFHHGLINMLSVLPVPIILFYIIQQAKAQEYTEMCTAIIALLFVILHILRTLWGLWQLYYFHSWTTRAIDGLRALGVANIISKSNIEIDSNTLASKTLVNETIIENQILHGGVRCFLSILGDSKNSSHPVNSLSRDRTASDAKLSHRFAICVKSFFLVPFFLIFWIPDSIAGLFCFERRIRYLIQVPYDPVDLWLRWSVCFAAQYLGPWMKNFDIPKDGRSLPSFSQFTARERFNQVAEHFALELLGSAWLQLWPEMFTETKPTSPIHLSAWDTTSEMARGRIVKLELLEKAKQSGTALPFGTSHNPKERYAVYERVLCQVIEELPVKAEFSAEIEKFNIDMLEWMTILLYLGNRCHERLSNSTLSDSRARPGCTDSQEALGATYDTVGHDSGDADTHIAQTSSTAGGSSITPTSLVQSRANAPNRVENTGFSWSSWFTRKRLANTGSSMDPWRTRRRPLNALPSTNTDATSNTTLKPDDITEDLVTSLAFSNLLSQLNMSNGTALCSKNGAGVIGDVQQLLQCLSINLEDIKFDHFSETNRHVLKVGELIDAWLALDSGEQFKYMSEQTQEVFWKGVCYGISQALQNDPRRNLAGWNMMRAAHAEVEKRRLHYNLLNKEDRFEHADQYITFMGYRMETVRSILATWVKVTLPDMDEDVFEPEVKEKALLKIKFSEDVSKLLVEDFESNSGRRSLQTRILWELQNALVEEGRHGPDSPDTIALCVLSFPSLEFSSKSQDMFRINSNQSPVDVPASGSGGAAPSPEHSNQLESSRSATLAEGGLCGCLRHVCIPISHSSPDRQQSSSSQSSLVNSPTPALFIHVLGGPQPCQIRLEFSGKSGIMEASLSIHLMQPENCFHWEKWKDAFLGRLLGFHEWQNLHNIPSVKLNLTTSRLDSGVPERLDRSMVLSWNGWKPFRIEFCRFELDGEDILFQRKITSTFHPTSRAAGKNVYTGRGLTRRTAVSVSYNVAPLDVLHEGYQTVLRAIPYVGIMEHDEHNAVGPTSQNSDVPTSRSRGSIQFVLESGEGRRTEATSEFGNDVTTCEQDISSKRIPKNFEGTIRDLLTERRRKSKTGKLLPPKAVIILESVVSKTLSSDSQKIMEDGIEPLLRCSQEIVESFGDDLHTCDMLPNILSPLWKHEHPSSPTRSKILNILRTMCSMSGSYAVLVEHAWDLMGSVATSLCNAAPGEHWPHGAIADTPTTETPSPAVGFQRDTLQFCQAVFTKVRVMKSAHPSLYKYTTYRLALSHAGGLGLPTNMAKAEELFNALVVDGYAPAMNAWALQVQEDDPGKAEELFGRAISESNLDHANYNLAQLLVKRYPEDEDKLKEVRDLYNSAIERSGHQAAMWALAMFMQRHPNVCATAETGVINNDIKIVARDKAERLYERLIREGILLPLNNLAAIRLEQGRWRDAEDLFRRAIEVTGYNFAAFNLARMLEEKKGPLVPNRKEAARLYTCVIADTKSVEGTDQLRADAMNNLAAMMYGGEGGGGVSQNVSKAIELYKEAIDITGSPKARFYLACILDGTHKFQKDILDFSEASTQYRHLIADGREGVQGSDRGRQRDGDDHVSVYLQSAQNQLDVIPRRMEFAQTECRT